MEGRSLVAAKQEAAAAQQEKQVEALTAGLQNVSAQLETSKTAPQVVLKIGQRRTQTEIGELVMQ